MLRRSTSLVRRSVLLAFAMILAVAALVPAVAIPDAARASEQGVVAPDGCTSGTLTVQRGVVGYEFWNVEQFFTQVELLMNPASAKFPSQLRYTVVTFATSGNVTAECTWTVPEGVTRGHLLVVGGGGAGGTSLGGGGGGGGVFYGKVPITTTLGAVFDPGAQLQVSVGSGGAAAATGCVGAACAGGSGGASTVAVGGNVVVSAGGGGGGGGHQQAAPAVGGGLHSAGGGGGGAALTDDGQAFAAGAAGRDASVANDPYNNHPGGLLGGAGGAGAQGASSGTVRISGGGGGAKSRAAQFGTGVGAGGVGITFSRGAVLYGAGGGGLQRGIANCDECFEYYSQPSGSTSSGGAGGTSASGGQGADGTGGGGGGGGASGQGGRGGAGIVMIAFPDPMEITGPETVSSTYGQAFSSDQYSFTNGNDTLDTTYRVRSAGSTGLADSPPAGISMSARRIVVGATAAAGTYDLVVIATSAIDTVATRAVTLTIARTTQAPVTFVSGAPGDASVDDEGDAPSFAGGDGTGAFLLTSTDTSVCAVTLVADAWQVAHVGEGTCELRVVRDEDTNHFVSAQTTRTYTVSAQEVIEEPVEEPVEEPTEESDDGVNEESVDEPGDEPAEESPVSEERSDESSDEPSKEPSDVPAEVVGPAGGPLPAPRIICSPALPWAGGTVTCQLSGGGVSEAVTWRASYNPTFAAGTTVLDVAGAGGFTFTVPNAALGAPLVLEIVGWGDPMMLAAALAGPVPGSIPSGAGPRIIAPAANVWPAGLVALLLVGLGRDGRVRRGRAR